MIIPLLDKIKKDDPFRVSLALSIPFAANIGGMATPIGTPPNAIALGFLSDHGIHVNFLQWVLLATPLALIMLLLTSAILFVLFKPQSTSLSFEFDSKRSLSTEAKEVLMIALLMIILWLTSYWHGMPDALIALLGVGLFAITGFLNSKDLKEINWDILVLMWGGLALGKGMEISGLTSWIIGMPLFNAQGFILIGSFCLLALLLSTFISNTATATLLIPIAMSLPNTNLTFLAITIALSCSASMALPISTPPNAIAFSTGAISSSHMLKAGSIVSIITVLIILLGFEHVLHFFLRFL